MTTQVFEDIKTTPEGDTILPCIRLTPDVIPKVQKQVLAKNSQTGVSTRNALSRTNVTTSGETKPILTIPNCNEKEKESSTISKAIKRKRNPHWYVLRVTYGREKKAYDYLIEKHVKAYYPTITTIKVVNGKRISVEESRIPNIFFAYGTEEEIKPFVYDNVNLPYLRFYYRRYHKGKQIIKEPLIVADQQIESLKKICMSEVENIIIETGEIPKFKTGLSVRVTDGYFKGVEGKIARYHGQQRVAVLIAGLLTACTAYIPSAFIEVLEQHNQSLINKAD